MIGILIQLAISWLLLWLVERKDLSVLGLRPTSGRLIHFIFGFVIAAALFTVYAVTVTFLSDNDWTVSTEYSLKEFLASSWWTTRSVIFEELIFRGALLYILIKRTSTRTACILSAVAFGGYHWFSFGVFGDSVQMTYVFVSTGIWGLMFAFAFAKTMSLYLPTGIHLGWNLFNIVIFSQGSLGQQFLVNSNNGQPLTGLPSIALQLFQIFALPVIAYFYLRNYKQTDHQNREVNSN